MAFKYFVTHDEDAMPVSSITYVIEDERKV